MSRFAAFAATAAALLVASPVLAATTIEGSVTSVTLRGNDPGLVVTATPIAFGPILLNPGQSALVNVLTIGTAETAVGLDDLVPYDITLGFSFTNPLGVSGGTITGETRGRIIFQDGIVSWDGPQLFTFGTGGSFRLALQSADFDTPGTATVRGRLTLLSDAAAVPEPATWAMMIGGFGLVGAAMRRRRETMITA